MTREKAAANFFLVRRETHKKEKGQRQIDKEDKKENRWAREQKERKKRVISLTTSTQSSVGETADGNTGKDKGGDLGWVQGTDRWTSVWT